MSPPLAISIEEITALENVDVGDLINLLQRLLDGEFNDDCCPSAHFAVLLQQTLQPDEMTSVQREILYLRSRLLNGLLLGRLKDEPPAKSPLLTLDFPGEFAVEEILELPAPWALLKTLSLLATFPVLTGAGAARREVLLGWATRLAGLEMPLTWPSVVLLSRAWMFCSYGSREDRHSIKATLNGIARRALDRACVGAESTGRRLTDRPRLLVIAEAIRSSHVQYRYFARYLKQFTDRFDVILAAPGEHLDVAARKLAHEVLELNINSVQNLATAVEELVKTRPDVVFWPSVGMASWGPFIANLRFAPLQIAALGHSASTFIPTMDYFLTESTYASRPELFSEILLVLPDDSLMFEDSPSQVRPSRANVQGLKRLKIAVPGNALKLNPGFVRALEEIDRRAGRDISFVFFPNLRDVQMSALREVICSRLRDAVIMPRMEPNDYLRMLSGCELALSPFPFGGLHSDIDVLCLGIPVVALQGAEPHARTDAFVLRRLGLEDRLLTHDVEGYIATATALIADDETRALLSAEILRYRPYDTFFGAHPPGLGTAVGDAVWAAYRHHEIIVASARPTWDLEQLLALG